MLICCGSHMSSDGIVCIVCVFFFFKQKTAYELRISDWSSDVCSSDLLAVQEAVGRILGLGARPSEKTVRALAEPWRPHRGAAAIFSWHCYNMDVKIGRASCRERVCQYV